MTESEFPALAEKTLSAIEAAVEQASIVFDIDIECGRTGNVLEIEFVDNGAKIIINSQAPMQEIWVAAKSGGYHFKYRSGRWINTRDESELFTELSKIISGQSGTNAILTTPEIV